MVLLDTNIIIYMRDPALAELLATKMKGQRLATCNVIVAEVLGYPALSSEDNKYFQALLTEMQNFIFDETVTSKVIEIRKMMRIQLPDAIIAASSLVSDAALWTHNMADFRQVPGLQLYDPLED